VQAAPSPGVPRGKQVCNAIPASRTERIFLSLRSRIRCAARDRVLRHTHQTQGERGDFDRGIPAGEVPPDPFPPRPWLARAFTASTKRPSWTAWPIFSAVPLGFARHGSAGISGVLEFHHPTWFLQEIEKGRSLDEAVKRAQKKAPHGRGGNGSAADLDGWDAAIKVAAARHCC